MRSINTSFLTVDDPMSVCDSLRNSRRQMSQQKNSIICPNCQTRKETVGKSKDSAKMKQDP